MWGLRKRVKRRLFLAIVCLVLPGVAFFVGRITAFARTESRYKTLLEERDSRLKAAGHAAYVTRETIKRGEVFTKENTEQRYVLFEQAPDTLAGEVIGKTACTELAPGVILTEALCCLRDFSETERECVFREIGFTEQFSADTVVDVRIRYANGENYCVLKKKRLRKEEGSDNECRFRLTEEEQLLMSAAQYDVEVYQGATLYLVAFLEERLQEDAVSAYLPSVQVLQQLQSWEEVDKTSFCHRCELRNALEERLSEYERRRREGLL